MKKEVYEFISKQTKDPTIERRVCRISGEEFAIFQGDVDLMDKLRPLVDDKKITLPLPIYAPWVRELKRQLFKNERFLYK